jgi:hypothetical protein
MEGAREGIGHIRVLQKAEEVILIELLIKKGKENLPVKMICLKRKKKVS